MSSRTHATDAPRYRRLRHVCFTSHIFYELPVFCVYRSSSKMQGDVMSRRSLYIYIYAGIAVAETVYSA